MLLFSLSTGTSTAVEIFKTLVYTHYLQPVSHSLLNSPPPAFASTILLQVFVEDINDFMLPNSTVSCQPVLAD